MRISKVRIENFRSFKDTEIPIDKYSVLIGPNGAGKSTVLLALKVFFGDTTSASTDISNLQEEDFHKKILTDPIRITVTFVDLNAEALEEFKEYYRQSELVVCARARWNADTRSAKVERVGWRNVKAAFAPYFDAKGDKQLVGVLREIYKGIRSENNDLPAETTEPKMTAALRAYESEHPDELELMESGDLFYGISGGLDRFKRHVQWVSIPAVKDAMEEQVEGKNTVLGQILSRTVRADVNFEEEIGVLKSELHGKYSELLSSKDEALDVLSDALQQSLQEWAHPNCSILLGWTCNSESPIRIELPYAKTTGGEGDFQGNLARFGHGFHRSYIFALLHVLANVDGPDSPTLILGCEEPELFQHPPQLRHLVSVFRRLSEGNAQVILCTHSPHFVTGESFEDVRMVKKQLSTGESKVSNCTIAQVAQVVSEAYPDDPPEWPTGALLKIHQSLQPELNEMFFSGVVVLVEGLEDLAYLTTYLHLLGKWGEFRRLGCHIVAPAHGKSSLVRPLSVAKLLRIPHFVVFDSDSHISEDRRDARRKHERDNKALFHLLGASGTGPFLTENAWGDRYLVWKSDIGKVVSEELASVNYTAILSETRRKYGDPGGVDKSSLFVAGALTEAWRLEGRSVSLERLCDTILNYARQHAGGEM